MLALGVIFIALFALALLYAYVRGVPQYTFALRRIDRELRAYRRDRMIFPVTNPIPDAADTFVPGELAYEGKWQGIPFELTIWAARKPPIGARSPASTVVAVKMTRYCGSFQLAVGTGSFGDFPVDRLQELDAQTPIARAFPLEIGRAILTPEVRAAFGRLVELAGDASFWCGDPYLDRGRHITRVIDIFLQVPLATTDPEILDATIALAMTLYRSIVQSGAVHPFPE